MEFQNKCRDEPLPRSREAVVLLAQGGGRRIRCLGTSHVLEARTRVRVDWTQPDQRPSLHASSRARLGRGDGGPPASPQGGGQGARGTRIMQGATPRPRPPPRSGAGPGLRAFHICGGDHVFELKREELPADVEVYRTSVQRRSASSASSFLRPSPLFRYLRWRMCRRSNGTSSGDWVIKMTLRPKVWAIPIS